MDYTALFGYNGIMEKEFVENHTPQEILAVINGHLDAVYGVLSRVAKGQLPIETALSILGDTAVAYKLGVALSEKLDSPVKK